MAWVAKLMPKEQQFFPLFEEQARHLVAAARALQAAFKSGDDVSRRSDELKNITRQAKETSNKILDGVRSTFVTPFNRVDIKTLIIDMDYCLRDMYEAGHGAALFGVKDFDERLTRIGESIVTAAEHIEKAMPLLADIDRNATQITKLCREVDAAKEKTDELFEEALKALYASAAGDAMGFVIRDKIYDRLATVTDRLAGIGNGIHDLVIDQV